MLLLNEEERGPENDEIAGMLARNPFSKYLPYRAYSEETKEYHLVDNSIGRLWECRPLAFVGDKTFKSLTSILRQEYPSHTIFHFCLYPDDHIEPVLDWYQQLKTRKDELVSEAAARYAEHISKGRAGIEKMRGIPTRNFRLFVSVKTPDGLSPEQVATIEEGLQSAGLAPVNMVPGKLLAWLRRLFNRNVPPNAEAYNDGRYIANQAIDADDPVEKIPGGMRFGGRVAACLSAKSTPESIDGLGMNCMIGGFGGSDEDATQLKHRFLWTTSVYYKANSSAIKKKASLMMAQRATGSLAKSLSRRNVEFDWVLDDLEKGPYCNVITSMWVFGEDEQDLNRGLARVRGLWEKQNFVVQRETQIQREMLLASLPFGLYTKDKSWNDVDLLDRDFQMSVAGAALMLPVQADFAGGMKPVMITVGRKGQLVTLDVFDKGASNYNFLVAAGSGSGKSFFTNFLVNNYYGTGALIRLTDIGFSYKKQCATVGGRFIDIGDQATKLCVNPFQVRGLDDEDAAGDDVAVAYVILTMIYSNTGTVDISETQVTLVKDAVRFARERDGGLHGIDHVQEYLAKYPEYAGDIKLQAAIDIAHEMGFNLRDYTTRGQYGSLFNGKTTLNIKNDEFVVFELEELQNNPELFRVMSLQVINAVTQDLYLNEDRSVRRFLLFDEAWKYLGVDENGSRKGAATSLIGKVIEEGYRRARKYGGSTGIVTQSPLDLPSFGPAGSVIKGNSAFKFFLESNTYVEAVKKGILDYNGLLFDLVCSVRNAKPNYSEILMDTPFGCGVSRLCLDPYNYWVNTTDPAEVARYEAAVAGGLTPREAMLKLSGLA
jgi:conjugal transfer ATP-binding protein TraC